jgi:hypothetical protein
MIQEKKVIRFFYLRAEPPQPKRNQDKKEVENAKGAPIACLSVFYDKANKKVSYGISTLNPLDTCKKSVAKDLAAGRLLRSPHTVNVWVPSMKEEDITCHYINRRILQDLLMLERHELPSRARKAAIRWLEESRKHDIDDGYMSLENVNYNEKLWDNVKE